MDATMRRIRGEVGERREGQDRISTFTSVLLLVLLDLSSAFDTVDHVILLQRLNTEFGIHGTVLEWYRSYLFRSIYKALNGAKSDSFDLKCGMPQGSCLGPLLFIMYASKLFVLTFQMLVGLLTTRSFICHLSLIFLQTKLKLCVPWKTVLLN